MKAAFHLTTCLRAEIEIADDVLKQRMVTEAVRFAQSLNLENDGYALVNVLGCDWGVSQCDFKILVRLSPPEIHLMTAKEADENGLSKLQSKEHGG